MPWSWGSVGGCLRSGRARKSAAYRAAVADAAASDGLDVAGSHPPNSQVRQYLPMTTLSCDCSTEKEVSDVYFPCIYISVIGSRGSDDGTHTE